MHGSLHDLIIIICIDACRLLPRRLHACVARACY
jgi:hypothetical protein